MMEKPRLKKKDGMWWCGLPFQTWTVACNPRDAYRLWMKCRAVINMLA